MLPILSSIGVVDVLPSFLHPFFPTDPAILNGVYMSEALNPIFVDNFERDPTLTWQYFGSSTGFFRLYPGKRAEIGFALSVQHNSFAGEEVQSGKSGGITAPRRAGCSEQNTPAWADEAEGVGSSRRKPLSPIRTSPSGTLPTQPQRSLLAGVPQKAPKHHSRAPCLRLPCGFEWWPKPLRGHRWQVQWPACLVMHLPAVSGTLGHGTGGRSRAWRSL